MFKSKKILTARLFAVAVSLLTSVALADSNDVPVVNLSSPGAYSDQDQDQNRIQDSNSNDNNGSVASLPTVDTSMMTTNQRLNRLEQQVNNLIQMNLPQQVAELQQQVQKLNGQLEEQAHAMDKMSEQQLHVEALPPTPPVPVPSPTQAPAPTNAVPIAAIPDNTLHGPTISPQTDSTDYQNAFSLLTAKQFPAAGEAFLAYIKNHPNGQFVANAHYWLGEIYLQQKNLTQASLEFSVVVQQYPVSNKVADAQLKLAIIHAQQGQTAQARQELQTVMQRYPDSTAAQSASVQLQQLNSSTRP